MLVNHFLERNLDRFADKTAVISGDRRLTFGRLESQANRLAHSLAAVGFKKQDRAAVYLKNSIESVVSLFGILKASGIFLILSPLYKARNVEFILNDCQVKVLITDRQHMEGIAEILPSCPNLQTIFLTDVDADCDSLPAIEDKEVLPWEDSLAAQTESRLHSRCIDIDLASLIYTSGSTGFPKGVMLTHLNMASAAASIIEYLENTPDDIIMDVIPLSFDYGLYQVLMAVKFGGTVVLEKSFLYPYHTVDLMLKEKVTGFPIVPAVAAILFKLRHLDELRFESLRYVTNTAQALPVDYIRSLQRIFPGVRIYSMYGLTECKRVSYLHPDELDRRPTSVGKAMPNTEVYLVDKNDRVIDRPDTVGELVVRGSNVMKGYWNRAEETAKYLRPGPLPGEKALYTGDLFKRDEEGFLYFISRRDEMIKVAGMMVSPKEIENVLCGMEDVAQAAVIGVDDEVTGQAVKAFVVLREGSRCGKKDILKHCKEQLAMYMIPKHLEIRSDLPQTPHGKIDKQALVKRSEGRGEI